jgi:Protein of unknown function (DUF1064)
MGAHFPLHSAGKRPAPARPPRPLRHERMSAVEARDLFPIGGDNARPKGRFPVAAKEFRRLDGIQFDSKLEMEFYAELRQRELAGEVAKIEYHPSWEVTINGGKLCKFTADFRYVEMMPKYGVRIVETKSSGTRKDASYRLRRRAAELAFGLTIIEVVRKRS